MPCIVFWLSLVLKQIAHAADGGDVRRDLRAHLGADASDMHVDGTGAAAVLKAPHAVQQLSLIHI